MTRAGLSIPSFELKVKLKANRKKRAGRQQANIIKEILFDILGFRGL